jgi:hypothetical protein
MNSRTSLITITSITATFVALCAAVFSVTGIATLFAGAALSAAIMASALELGKVVGISFLYQYWAVIPRLLKYYLSVASVILMLITSAGIYGYLSSAYAKVAATPLQLNADIQNTEGRVSTIQQDIQRKNDRLNQLIQLRSQQENRLDGLINKSASGNNSIIRSAQNNLATADKSVQELQKEITKLSDTKDSLTAIGITKKVEIETNSDIGTFIYIAKVFGTELDTVVKWFTLIIVFVFDPLAIALVIAVNFLLKQKSTESNESLVTNASTHEEPYKIYTTELDAPVLESEVTVEPNQPSAQETDPHPQYMTATEVDSLLEKWWARRNGKG